VTGGVERPGQGDPAALRTKMAGANAGESSPRPSCVVAAGGTGPASRRYPV